MKTNFKFLLLTVIFLFFYSARGFAQTKSIKVSTNWQATKTGENTPVHFQSSVPNYYSLAVFDNKNNRIREAGISFWNLKNSEVLNFNLKERSFGAHLGYGWNLLSLKEEKIQIQLVNSLRGSYEFLKSESKFFETVYDKNSSIGAAILINPRVNFQFNSKWSLLLESQAVPFIYRFSSIQSFAEGESYQKSTQSTVDFFEEFSVGIGIGYKI